MEKEPSREEVMALWRACFGDSGEFTRFYFDAKYRDENALVHRDASGTAVAALQSIPYEMTYAGGVISATYVSGACTLPAWRGQGIMTRLLARSLRRDRQRGIALSLLIPGSAGLFDYYGRQGYAPVFEYRVVEEEAAREGVPGLQAREARPAEAFPYFDARSRERGCCVQHDREDFSAIVTDLHAGGGTLLGAFTASGSIAGVALAVPAGGRVLVKDFACDSPAARRALVAGLAARWQGWRQEWRELPVAGAATRHGMARVVDAGRLLQAYAASRPGERLAIRVADEILPANSGVYMLRDGECRHVKRHAGTTDAVMDAGELTGWLSRRFPGDPPYMSLMLD
jgi:GNAT superfamily N-acetyltransferase